MFLKIRFIRYCKEEYSLRGVERQVEQYPSPYPNWNKWKRALRTPADYAHHSKFSIKHIQKNKLSQSNLWVWDHHFLGLNIWFCFWIESVSIWVWIFFQSISFSKLKFFYLFYWMKLYIKEVGHWILPKGNVSQLYFLLKFKIHFPNCLCLSTRCLCLALLMGKKAEKHDKSDSMWY